MHKRKRRFVFKWIMAIGINGLFLCFPVSQMMFFWFSNLQEDKYVQDVEANLQALKIENEFLKLQLKEKEELMNLSSSQIDCIYARITSFHRSSGLMRIQTESEVLQKHLAVMSSSGLIGKIVYATQNEALVETLERTNFQSQWPVVIVSGQQTVRALLVSSVTGLCKAVLLENIPVHIGDSVLTGNDSMSVVSGIVVGKVVDVKETAVWIKTNASIMNEDSVCVVRKKS